MWGEGQRSGSSGCENLQAAQGIAAKRKLFLRLYLFPAVPLDDTYSGSVWLLEAIPWMESAVLFPTLSFHDETKLPET